MAKEELYEIEFLENGEFDFHSIPDGLTMLMCDIKDNGDRYSQSSRYNYSYNGFSESSKGFQFGKAKACIQGYLLSIKKENLRFNVNAVFPSGSKLKVNTIKQ